MAIPSGSARVRILAVALLLLAVPVVTPPAAHAELPEALTTIRIVHAVPGAPGVDLLLDEQPVTANVSFGEVGAEATTTPGDHTLTIVATGGSGGAIVEEDVTLDEGAAYIYSLFGTVDAPRGRINEVNLDALPSGQARLRLINLAHDTEDLDLVEQGGAEIFDRVAFDRDTPYADITTGPHQFEIRGGKGQQTTLAEVAIEATDGVVYDLVVFSGTDASSVETVLIATSASPPCSTIVGIGTPSEACVRVVNASAQGEAGLAIADSTIATGMAPGDVTGFIPVAAGEKLALEPLGFTESETGEIDLTAGQAYVIVIPGGEKVNPIVAQTDLTPLPPGQARLRLIHVAPALGEVDISLPTVDDDLPLYPNLDTDDVSRYRVLNAGRYEIHFDHDDARFTLEIALEPGQVYDAVLRPGVTSQPELLVVTSPAEIRGEEGTPVAAAPGATPIPAAPEPTPTPD